LMDVGEENCIHPANKKVGGERLAYIALAQTYHLKGFGWACPTYEAIEITEGRALVKFKNASLGLTSFGNTLKNFKIAGADKIFYPAEAAITGGAVVLTSPFVKAPVAVRYAFEDFVVGDLFSTEGLPVASFRTDDW
ncbi:MAG: sialate O-acetylesterase, partial [Sphingobacterium sp.]